MLRSPTLEILKNISEEYTLNVKDDELKVYSEFIAHDLESQKLLEDWEIPVENMNITGRTSHRAKPEENKYNAWYYKCQISHPNPQSKLLSGYKLAIKDNITLAGVPLMDGSKVLEGYVPPTDATVVKRMLEHGASIIGTATCENLCLSGASFNTTYGPVKNPWNPQYSAGGSSSGSAVLVAAGEVDMSLGCDQGGSIRIPSSSCGIVGLKPTFGLVPYTGIIPIDATLDHVGPMAKTVTDCARLLTAIAGFDDEKDHRQPSCGFKCPDFVSEVSSVKPGLFRIGILKEGFNECDDEVVQCINRAVDLIKKANIFQKVDEVSIPDHDKAMIAYGGVLFPGCLNQLIDGLAYGTGIGGVLLPSLVEKLYEGSKSKLHTLHHLGKEVILSMGYLKKYGGSSFYKYYAKGQTLGWYLKKEYDQMLARYDILLMPTLSKLPSKIPDKGAPAAEVMSASADMIRNTAPFNLTHHPALTVNAGYDEKTGLPIGLQLVGRLWDDATVLKVGKLVEDVLKNQQKPFLTN